MSMYPEGLSEAALCYIEGCTSNPCRRCGQTNYPLLGYMGAITRWAKAWGVSKEEALERIERKHFIVAVKKDFRSKNCPLDKTEKS